MPETGNRNGVTIGKYLLDSMYQQTINEVLLFLSSHYEKFDELHHIDSAFHKLIKIVTEYLHKHFEQLYI